MKRIQYIFTLLSLGFIPYIGNAAELYNPLGGKTIPELIGFVIQAFLGISGSLALAMIVYGGFLWLTSAGKPERITKGQQTLLWSVIGLVVIFGANVLANFVISTLGGATAG